MLCDPGVNATDPVEGNLTPFVDACKDGYRFDKVGLLGCSVDTSKAGNYSIVYQLRDSASGMLVSMKRTVVVMAPCTFSELRCGDFTCSIDGFCLMGAKRTLTNQPPVLRLNPVAGELTTYVALIPRGFNYSVCTDGSYPSKMRPCETGALSGLLRDCVAPDP